VCANIEKNVNLTIKLYRDKAKRRKSLEIKGFRRFLNCFFDFENFSKKLLTHGDRSDKVSLVAAVTQ